MSRVTPGGETPTRLTAKREAEIRESFCFHPDDACAEQRGAKELLAELDATRQDKQTESDSCAALARTVEQQDEALSAIQRLIGLGESYCSHRRIVAAVKELMDVRTVRVTPGETRRLTKDCGHDDCPHIECHTEVEMEEVGTNPHHLRQVAEMNLDETIMNAIREHTKHLRAGFALAVDALHQIAEIGRSRAASTSRGAEIAVEIARGALDSLATPRTIEPAALIHDPSPRSEAVNLPRWKCRQCGCLWRDNLDKTVSLFDANQKSCDYCEHQPTAKACVVDWFKAHADD